MGVLASLRACNGSFRAASRLLMFGYIRGKGISVSANEHCGKDSVLPVLIVGAGPVGLVLSILLTKLGVRCAVLEKNKSFSAHPQAHFINNRSMEVFRKLDGLADQIERLQPPVDLWRRFIYCTSLTGSVLGMVDHMQPQDFEKVVSPVSVAHFSQYKLTRLLVEHLKSLDFQISTRENLKSTMKGGAIWGREILMGHECVSIDTSSDDGVSVTVSFFEEGEFKERNIRCRVLIGADGAGSTVRRLMGIDLIGEKDLQNLVSVHFSSQDLGSYLLNERPGMLYFVFNPEAIGVLVAHDLEQGEFILQIPFYPPQQDIKDFSPQICSEIIFKLVGRELSDIHVIDVKPWIMHAEVGEKYVCCDNRILLVGDAAHRFPPAGGFGMNTGIQDAHNLAWKLASVLEGPSPPSFLQTYEAERRPVALFNTALSLKNFRAAMSVPSALGLDPKIANSVHRVVNVLPHGIQKTILDGIFYIGRMQLSEFLLNESNPLGSSRLEKLNQIFNEGRSLQLQFPAEDLGFRYSDGAIVPDRRGPAPLESPTGRRRDYIPSADPGSRLPHMNVRILSNSSKEDIISTLDLVHGNKIEFLLMVAPTEDSYHLAHAAFEVAKEFEVSARICVVWPQTTASSTSMSSKEALAPWENFIDIQEVERSPQDSLSSSWWNICQMSDRGAILVRPDEHVAWRVKSSIAGDPMKEMRRVFSAVLGVK
ncbi:hypothetical protein SAY86_020043 [Trapa natans]|uniref:FAD-binding domain-containing protein n=1 Tax=Trapa natans TaxID=22666 RepID=A0AAN7LP47_TRANT|nr:hypothetical protein SAY86_020043 [Trapa natans]